MKNLFTEALKESEPSLVNVIRYRNEKAMLMKKQEEQREIDHQKWLERKREENKDKPLNFSRKEKIKDMLKTLNGLPPHNTGGNICYGDGYFSNSIPAKEGNKEYDTAMEELIQEFGPTSTWSRFMDKIWDM